MASKQERIHNGVSVPILLVILLSAFPPWGTLARADDWPQFRGPTRDGVWHETGLLESFPPEGLNILWRTPVGPGWSSPVVSQSRVFLTDMRLQQPAASERVLCFEESTGKSLWTHEHEVTLPDWAFVPGQGGAPSATPVADGANLYTMGPSGYLLCLDVERGTVVWDRDLATEFQINQLSCRPSPLIDGERLIVFTGASPGASLLALDKTTGKEIWRALDDPISNSSPVIVNAAGVRQLIVWTGASVASLNPATGAVYWREAMVTSNNDDIATPVVEGNLLLVSGLMMELDSVQPLARVRWPEIEPAGKRILSNTSTALLQGGYVYAAKSDGELVCLEAQTGKALWATETVTGRKGGASIHITPADGRVFLFTDEGELILARLSPEGYTEISRVPLLAPTTPFAGRKYAWTPPAYARGHVFARNDEELVCASLASIQ